MKLELDPSVAWQLEDAQRGRTKVGASVSGYRANIARRAVVIERRHRGAR